MHSLAYKVCFDFAVMHSLLYEYIIVIFMSSFEIAAMHSLSGRGYYTVIIMSRLEFVVMHSLLCRVVIYRIVPLLSLQLCITYYVSILCRDN